MTHAPPLKKVASPPRRSDAKFQGLDSPALNHTTGKSATPAIPDHRREFLALDVVQMIRALQTGRSTGLIYFTDTGDDL
jgi:hypothetical protein